MKYFKIPFALVISWIIVEIISFIFLVALDTYRQNLIFGIKARVEDFKATYYFKPLDFGLYDPLTQFSPIANSVLDGQRAKKENENGSLLNYNAYGFLDNGNNFSEFTFPEKKNTFRIILLGGSSALGAPGNWENFIPSHKTIASILERKLNDKSNNIRAENTFFQVLNFAQIGGWSGNNLVRLTQYLIYLDPDMVLSYNGFNDALMGKSQGQPYLNWNFISYPNYIKYNLGHKYVNTKINRNKIFPYTSSLINKFYTSGFYSRILNDKQTKLFQELEQKNPLPKIITNYLDSDINKTPVYIKNTEMMASILEKNKIYFINYLQPSKSYEKYLFNINLNMEDAGLTKEDLNESKSDKFEEGEATEAGPDQPSISNKEVRNIDNNIMYLYSNEFLNLSLKYKNNKYLKFKDKTNIFRGNSKGLYQPDGFHLTPEGNEIIAEHFFEDIIKIFRY